MLHINTLVTWDQDKTGVRLSIDSAYNFNMLKSVLYRTNTLNTEFYPKCYSYIPLMENTPVSYELIK